MANYSLIAGSKFQPFSFERYILPYQIYGLAFREVENAMGEMELKASIWDLMANEQTDPEAYRMYKNYADDLRNQTDYLIKYGLNANSRRGMMNLKSRYSKEIVPIENAYRRREELAKELRAALASNPTMFYLRDMATTSLDDFIKNPSLDYGQSYSGAVLAQLVGLMAANLKSLLTGRSKMKGVGLPYQYEQLILYGYTPEQIWLAINNPKEGNPILNTIVELALDASGMKEWASPTLLAKARAYATEGLYNAIGKIDIKNFTDSYSAQKNLQRLLGGNGNPRSNRLAINPLNIYNSRKLSKEEEDYKNMVSKYSKYFYKEDGQWKMNHAGWEEYNKKYHILETNAGPRSILYKSEYTDSPFKTLMDSLGITNISQTSFGPWLRSAAGSVWGKYVDDSPAAKTAKYDASKVTEFDYSIDSSQLGDMKDALLTANRGLDLHEVDYDSNSKTFKETGETISMEDLNSDDYKVVATRFSPYGNTVMIKDKDGDVKRYHMPSGINTINEYGRDMAMLRAYLLQQIINTGQYTDKNGNTRAALPSEIALALLNYENALLEAYLYHSLLGVRNKTKEQEYSPYGY